MTERYVTLEGNDTSGDGTITKPWATPDKFFATFTSGDNCNIGSGTYACNSSGTGLLNATKNPNANKSIIRSINGNADWVVIQGASHVSTNVLIQGNGNLEFQDITFNQRISTNAYNVRINCVVDSINISFIRCKFAVHPDGVSNSFGLYVDTADAKTFTGLLLQDCIFTADASDSRCVGLKIVPNSTTGQCINPIILNCSFFQTGFGGANGIWLNGCSGAQILGGTFSAYGSCPILCGVDGASGGKVTTVTISNVIVQNMNNAIAGHGILMGNGCTSCVVDGAIIHPYYDYGIVLKEHIGTEVKNCHIWGDDYSAIYFKAAVNPNVHNNKFYGTAGATNGVVKLGKGDTNNMCSGTVFTNNYVEAMGNVGIFGWGDATHDAGGGICDYNVYKPFGPSRFGSMRSDTQVLSLSELRAAWAGYGDGSNDAHSKLWKVSRGKVLPSKNF